MIRTSMAEALALHFPKYFPSGLIDQIRHSSGWEDQVDQAAIFDICWRIANEEKRWESIAVERSISGHCRGFLFTDTTPDDPSQNFVTFTELQPYEYGIALALVLLKSRGVDIGDEDE